MFKTFRNSRYTNLTVLAVSILGLGFLGACETVEGAGEDIESAGEAVQDAAN